MRFVSSPDLFSTFQTASKVLSCVSFVTLPPVDVVLMISFLSFVLGVAVEAKFKLLG